ncbi:MAG: alpha/beta fold hydrolase [Promethearchaeota archaeon]
MENTIIIGGNEINFSIEGDGDETLLFVHGIGTNSLIWQAQVEYFSLKYKTVTFDWKGSGKSRLNEPNPDFSLEHLVKDLSGVVEKLNLRNPYIVAQDFSGVIALKAEIEDAISSNGIILINSADKIRIKPKYKALAKWILNKTPSLSIREAMMIKDAFEGMKQEIVEKWLKTFGNIDISNETSIVTTPVDFIVGAGNNVVKISDVESVVSRIPHSRIVVFQRNDFISLEAKNELNEEINDFINNYIPSIER